MTSYRCNSSWSYEGLLLPNGFQLTNGGSLYGTFSDRSGAVDSRVSMPVRPLSYSGYQAEDRWASRRGSREGILSTNEKATMQNLNDRLGSYLEKVRELESANAELEQNIQDWHAKRMPRGKRDYSTYEKTIADLQEQIATGRLHKARLMLQMDNAKLATEDFSTKYQNEKTIRQQLEDDVERIRKLLDNLTIVKTDLEMEVEGLRKDLICMKKKHQEELSALRSQRSSSTVSVELKAPPSADLSRILSEVREGYEAIIEKHRQEAAERYKQQASLLHQELNPNTEILQHGSKEVFELQRVYQDLQIKVQAELSRKSGLERTLEETKCNVSEELQAKQRTIFKMEAELSNLRNDLSRQQTEHQILLDIKSRLENEIATYRNLLEGDDISRMSTSELNHYDANSNRSVKTIVKDFVNGRVVSSKVSEIPLKA